MFKSKLLCDGKRFIDSSTYVRENQRFWRQTIENRILDVQKGDGDESDARNRHEYKISV